MKLNRTLGALMSATAVVGGMAILSGCGGSSQQQATTRVASKPARLTARAGFVLVAPKLGHNPTGKILGAIPLKTARVPHAFGGPGGVTVVVYHGGPVMHSVTAHAIFWAPPGFSFAPGFQSVVEKFLNAISSASGTTSDVYAVARQYYDTTGPIANKLSFGGSINISDPLPASGCNDAAFAQPCLTGEQLQTVVAQAVDTRGLPHGLADQYILFTPPGIASCDTATSGAPCYGTVYCAYHTFTSQDPSSAIVWLNMPTAVLDGCNPFGQEPNANPADVILNGLSHEMVEAMTDPLASAWFSNDQGANEVGDKCFRTIPPMLGGAPGAQYDQLIAGAGFALQPEWSNLGSDCAMALPHAPPWPSFAVSGAAVAGRPVSFDASHSAAQDGVQISSFGWDFGDGGAGTGATTSHVFQSGGQHQVTLTVTDSSGAQSTYMGTLAGGL